MNTQVSIIMGSVGDYSHMESAKVTLDNLGIPNEVQVMSAHRTPEEVVNYVCSATKRGVKVFIAGAGLAAHLAGFVAAFTHRPVIAVPLANSLQGLDALL